MQESGVDKGRKRTGAFGEHIASLYLDRKGYTVRETNYRKPWGEIDIIAERHGIVHFVEVKSISVTSLSRERDYRPEELVDARKLRKLARTASLYMESKKDLREFQIDVVGVLLDQQTRTARCRLFEQVLEDNL